MASLAKHAASDLRIAVEGCGHGTLHEIYASVKKSCELKGWSGVDLLIIGGDFQAVRNAYDLKAVAMPEKYYAMHDFHEYYSGKRTAPYLTIFIGGNHEASNYMWELYYGGWAAPNIYYMGAANVVRLGPLRIAGLSGIWKGYNYWKPHYERIPYNNNDVRSIYHVRELDTRKLLQLRSQVDVGLSHDWPAGMEWKGDWKQLFRLKPHFEKDALEGRLGNKAATTVLERLRPAYWFSAHMHAKYSAVWEHEDGLNLPVSKAKNGDDPETVNEDEIDLEMDDSSANLALKNDDEIDLDLDDTPAISSPKNDARIDLDMDAEGEPDTSTLKEAQTTVGDTQEVSEDIRNLLPESFAPSAGTLPFSRAPELPFPDEITNKVTQFLALDKCLPDRHFLQLLEITPLSPAAYQRPLKLEYDQEWVAITRVFAEELQLGDPNVRVPPNKGSGHYRPLIEKEMEWVEENIVKPGKMTIPEDFEQTAEVYDSTVNLNGARDPIEYSNKHTQGFCDLLKIPNAFHATDMERAQRLRNGPRPDSVRPDGRGGHRSGRRGRGQGSSRARGPGPWWHQRPGWEVTGWRGGPGQKALWQMEKK